jgi:predicted RNase H-like nuclease (RuvC/YqgF family)
MPGNTILRSLTLVIAGVSFFSVGLAAQDAPSVAEAARRAREQKQTVAKPARVVTDDTLTPAPSTPASSSPADSTAQSDNPAAPASKPAESAEEEAKKKEEIEALKREIADKQQSVNLLQREIALAQDTFYSSPDHDRDKAGKEKLDAMQSDVKQQRAALAELQAKLADLAPPAETKPAGPSKP